MSHSNRDSFHITNKKIAYIIGTFPLLTTTFIDREILEAKRIGINTTLVAIRRPPPFNMSPEVEHLANQTYYLLPVPWLKFFEANLYFILTRFWTYLSMVFYLFTRPHQSVRARLKTILHFGEGVWAAFCLRPESIDFIHAHFADRAATVAWVASRFLNIAYSLTVHANDIYVSPVLLPEKIQNAQFVTTCTKSNQSYLEELTGLHIELVYHGIDITKIQVNDPPVAKAIPPLILSVGQLKEKKGFPYLIKACKLLKDRGYDFKCEIIGEGPDRADLETLITDLNLPDTVILRGSLSNAEVMIRYTQASLFTLPCVLAGNADRDGIPNVILEAMIMQVPVVSTHLSGIPEVIQHGDTGLLVESGNQVELAEALATLLNNDQLRQRLGQNGRHVIEQNFDIRLNIDKLARLFNNPYTVSKQKKEVGPSAGHLL